MIENGRKLLPEYPLMVLPTLAEEIGLNEAIVLQQIHFWVVNFKQRGEERYHRDGHWWVYNSISEWRENFPWWSESTIRRALKSLRADGLVVRDRTGEPGKQTSWYRVNYEAVRDLDAVSPNPEESVQSERGGDSKESVQSETPHGSQSDSTPFQDERSTPNARDTETITETTTTAPAREDSEYETEYERILAIDDNASFVDALFKYLDNPIGAPAALWTQVAQHASDATEEQRRQYIAEKATNVAEDPEGYDRRGIAGIVREDASNWRDVVQPDSEESGGGMEKVQGFRERQGFK